MTGFIFSNLKKRTEMKTENLIKAKQANFEMDNYIQFDQSELQEMDIEQCQKVINHFHGHTLMKLPDMEIEFFEWLKIHDNPVWNDLWDNEDDLYKVSIDLLPQFLPDRNGFPICDLAITNYFFTVKHIKPKGLEEMHAILAKTENNKKLNIDELLLFDLHLAPTDIWHFAYRYDIPLSVMKDTISEMDYKGWIVHLSESADLLRYIDF